MTCREDAEDAIASGADALGFNLWPHSRRFLALEEHQGWIQRLPPFVTRVAVLVNASLEEAERVARSPAFDAVQLHGDEDAAYCAAVARFGRPFIKALRVRDRRDIARADQFGTRQILIDAHVDGAFGGTGRRIDLDLAAELVRSQPGLQVILAGGLTAENVAETVRAVQPYAVDVASGVEAVDGRKDREKMRAFVEAATAGWH
ncbi:MAG: phosphoribosylanthranilate isomerase [Verrucomicrobiota bacterium]|nr:phosphoribosylanthranilate isomerase [Verrucomicrobiota bacterium]